MKPLPGELIPGYALLAAAEAAPEQGIFIPLSSLPTLTAAEAATADGDGREVVRAVIEAAYQSSAVIPDADKAINLTLTKSQPQGIGPDEYRETITVTARLKKNPTTQLVDIVAEPAA
ncbi:MAG: hypothetical protein AAGG51_23010 [Cyanobacteria bacterium P01_G01_bin.54]